MFRNARSEVAILRIGLIVPPGFSVLSFAPLSVFEVANAALQEPLYEVSVVSAAGGRVVNSFGKEVETDRLGASHFGTLLHGAALGIVPAPPAPLSLLRKAAASTPRITAILHGCVLLVAT